MLNWVYKGSKVICAKELPSFENIYNDILPVKGEIYTIKNIVDLGPKSRGIYISVTEIINMKPDYIINGIKLDETYFSIEYFRPVIKTDISIFTNMLKTKECENV